MELMSIWRRPKASATAGPPLVETAVACELGPLAITVVPAGWEAAPCAPWVAAACLAAFAFLPPFLPFFAPFTFLTFLRVKAPPKACSAACSAELAASLPASSPVSSPVVLSPTPSPVSSPVVSSPVSSPVAPVAAGAAAVTVVPKLVENVKSPPLAPAPAMPVANAPSA
ncbi:hypothetical protein C8R45DRAFT_1002377 [Mycena sanguinolenta]|nr:hypothetical protein C8R45DRAFT_1002377 [Mycena sanguinolenta]